MGCVMKMYRDWQVSEENISEKKNILYVFQQLSGDDDFLKRNWEQVKKVLGFAWLPNSWDANQDGVEEGEQHNTMDVSYYGK